MPDERPARGESPEDVRDLRPEEGEEISSRDADEATTWGSWPRLPDTDEGSREEPASEAEEPKEEPKPADAGPDPLRSALDQLEHLQYELPSEGGGPGDGPGGKLQEIVADLASSVWAIRGEVEDLPRRADVAALRTAVESVGRTLRQEFAEIEAARDEAGGLLAARVEAALEGVRADLDAVSTVVRKKLTEADGRRKHDHASLIKVVDDALRNLSLRVTDLETRWQEFGDEVAARAGESLRGELSRAVVDAMSDVRSELKATMAASPTAELQKELREAIAAVGDEVDGLRQRIEGWGKPRTAPRIAKELQDLKGRVTRTEGDLRGAIVKEIDRVLDERLDAFSSALEARVAALLQPEARRGKRFGRGG